MTDAPRVVEGVASLQRRHGRLAVALGVFDGLHRGHRHLLRRLVRQAGAWRATPAVITFDAHPDAVLRGAAPPLLLDPRERLVRLAMAGVEVVVVEHFDDRLRRTPYDVFVEGISARVDLAGFVMTPDSAFGHERRGTPSALEDLGRSAAGGFEVAVVPQFSLDGAPVSSSAIRAAIATGDLDDARTLLGRAHGVIGDRRGAADGLRFGLPVALPPAGVYQVRLAAFQGRAPIPSGRAARIEIRPEGGLTGDLPAADAVRIAFPGR